MRRDMHKVLTTRPRYGGNAELKSYDKKNRPRETRHFKGAEVDLRPKQESMRKRHRVDWNGKEFSDYLAPLERYLRKQAGRPWDDVWSEICEIFRGNGTQMRHIRQHIKWEVDGIPHSGEPFFDHKEKHRPSFGAVYVDENGIVRKNPKK